MNCGRFLSTTILTTHAGTVSFNSTPSISPAASLTNNLYKGLPPTSLKYNYNFIVNYNSKYLIKFIKKKMNIIFLYLNITGVWVGTEKYRFPPLVCIEPLPSLLLPSFSSSTCNGLHQCSSRACSKRFP